MNKWITELIQLESTNAVHKAKADIADIARTIDYHPLYVFINDFSQVSDQQLFMRVDGATAKVRTGDLVAYQYPTYCSVWYDMCFTRDMRWRGAKVVLILHDVDILRDIHNDDELNLFNEVNLLIVHSPAMKEKLLTLGIKTPMIVRGPFDYLADEHDAVLEDNLEKKLVFAGHLSKSKVLAAWNYQTPLIVFGEKWGIDLSEKVEYGGEYVARELIRWMPKNRFGIVWDKKSEEENVLQEYTRYNSPHKFSLYLSLGLPVFVWDQSAVSRIVKKYGLGFAISSLDEIDPILEKLSDEDLAALKKRANAYAKALREGFFTKKSLMEAEEALTLDEFRDWTNSETRVVQ